MKCKNCKNEIENENDICTKCKLSKEDIKKADKLTLLSEILIYVEPLTLRILLGILTSIVENAITFIVNLERIIGILSFISGLTILIYTRIKYPKHKKSKSVLISTIVLIILIVLLLIWIIDTLNNCKLPG